jgi:Helix-turn-helix domain
MKKVKPKTNMTDHSMVERWNHSEIFDEGYVAIPTRLLKLYQKLKPFPLKPGEVLFILELMAYKWSATAPFPSYHRIAECMGVSDKMVRRYAQSLEAKKYLRREIRANRTNLFDLSGFFDALLEATKGAKSVDGKKK